MIGGEWLGQIFFAGSRRPQTLLYTDAVTSPLGSQLGSTPATSNPVGGIVAANPGAAGLGGQVAARTLTANPRGAR